MYKYQTIENISYENQLTSTNEKLQSKFVNTQQYKSTVVTLEKEVDFFCSAVHINPKVNKLKVLNEIEELQFQNRQFFNPDRRYVPVTLYWDYGKRGFNIITKDKRAFSLEFGRNNSRELLKPLPLFNDEQVVGALNLVVFLFSELIWKKEYGIDKQLELLNSIAINLQINDCIGRFVKTKSEAALKEIKQRINRLKKIIHEELKRMENHFLILMEGTFNSHELVSKDTNYSFKVKGKLDMEMKF